MTRRGWILLILLGIVWGIPYVLIRVAVADYHPVIVAFGRAVVGAAILVPVAVRKGVLLAGFRKPGWVGLYTVLELSGPWLLIGYAETRVASSTAGLIIALTPTLAAAIVMFGDPGSRSMRRIAGLVVGLVGVAALMGLDTARPHVPAIIALMLAAAGYALGPLVVAKKLPDHDATGVVAASLAIAAALYLPAVPAHWPPVFSGQATAAIVALAAVCTAFAFTLMFELIREVGAARSTLVAYVNPGVAVLLGVLLFGEPFSITTLAGFILIAGGTVLATHGSKRNAVAIDSAPLSSEGSAAVAVVRPKP